MKVFSWNVLADCHVRPSWYPHVQPRDLEPQSRRARVLSVLKQVDADVVLLQEVDTWLLTELRRMGGRHWIHAPHSGEGVAVGTREPVRSWEAVDLGSKSALVADLQDEVRVACVHLTWTGRDHGEPRRGVAQLERVLDWSPDLVGGDFNALPQWPESQLMAARGYMSAGPQGPTCNVNQWLQPLDAIWIRGRSLSSMPLPPIGPSTPLPGALCPSDHLPLLAIVELGRTSERRPLFSGCLF